MQLVFVCAIDTSRKGKDHFQPHVEEQDTKNSFDAEQNDGKQEPNGFHQREEKTAALVPSSSATPQSDLGGRTRTDAKTSVRDLNEVINQEHYQPSSSSLQKNAAFALEAGAEPQLLLLRDERNKGHTGSATPQQDGQGGQHVVEEVLSRSKQRLAVSDRGLAPLLLWQYRTRTASATAT